MIAGNVAKGSYKYKFSKKLRKLLDPTVQDPDTPIHFDIVVVLFTAIDIDADYGVVQYANKNKLMYQTSQRKLEDMLG
jgi:hypothetical protein